MKTLKKIVLKIPFDPRYKELLDQLTKYEILQIHRLDGHYVYVTQKFRFKDSKIHPKDFEGKLGIEFIETLVEDKKRNEYICFVKHHWFEGLNSFFENNEIILEPPIIMKDENLIITFITDSKHIDSILNYHDGIFGEDYKIMSISSVLPNRDNLNLILTERQKEIVYYAVENGYYEIPRKINSKEIAKHFNISKSAFCEHIRKVEKVIFNSIFS